MDKLAIDQPNYASYTKSREKGAALCLLASRLHGALRTRVDRIQRGRAADIKAVSLLAAEAQIGDGLGYMDLAEQVAVGSVAAHAVFVRIAPTHGTPDPAGRVRTHSVGNAGFRHFRKHLAVRHLSPCHV